jgi:hypothetical protein
VSETDADHEPPVDRRGRSGRRRDWHQPGARARAGRAAQAFATAEVALRQIAQAAVDQAEDRLRAGQVVLFHRAAA